jgi:hypothetical protein
MIVIDSPASEVLCAFVLIITGFLTTARTFQQELSFAYLLQLLNASWRHQARISRRRKLDARIREIRLIDSQQFVTEYGRTCDGQQDPKAEQLFIKGNREKTTLHHMLLDCDSSILKSRAQTVQDSLVTRDSHELHRHQEESFLQWYDSFSEFTEGGAV